MINITNLWHDTFPGAHVGVLLLSLTGSVDNSPRPTPLDARKCELERALREQYGGWTRADLLALEPLQAYGRYYKHFGNTYHVQGQLESVLKGKPLPSVSPLVDANFAAELETFVLSASHDADLLETPLTVSVSRGDEPFVQLGGRERALRAGDMMMSDSKSVVCTVLSGQDARTQIVPTTRRALYVAYAPIGVGAEAVARQLETIRRNVLLFAPDAQTERLEVYASRVAHA